MSSGLPLKSKSGVDRLIPLHYGTWKYSKTTPSQPIYTLVFSPNPRDYVTSTRLTGLAVVGSDQSSEFNVHFNEDFNHWKKYKKISNLFRHYWIYHGESLHDIRKFPRFMIEMKKAEFWTKGFRPYKNNKGYTS
ncbi:hypothetical protein T12_15450 [Trichinella patagoniensis]|uniref:Uncharacterized protein n=1 Tax=Trichinella patagoniensis TaxID=990121 RepID=A0A0V1A751_9BILA|nr:hypothetical protein T12_15450 [Trichinella patagoniensis]